MRKPESGERCWKVVLVSVKDCAGFTDWGRPTCRLRSLRPSAPGCRPFSPGAVVPGAWACSAWVPLSPCGFLCGQASNSPARRPSPRRLPPCARHPPCSSPAPSKGLQAPLPSFLALGTNSYYTSLGQPHLLFGETWSCPLPPAPHVVNTARPGDPLWGISPLPGKCVCLAPGRAW